MNIQIEVVPESLCPTCGGGDEFFNRPKVGASDGTWWWKCYNQACDTGYYNPDTGEQTSWTFREQEEK